MKGGKVSDSIYVLNILNIIYNVQIGAVYRDAADEIIPRQTHVYQLPQTLNVWSSMPMGKQWDQVETNMIPFPKGHFETNCQLHTQANSHLLRP
jgi:hypothetical protein